MRSGVPGRPASGGGRRTLWLGLGSAFALALAAASSTAGPSLVCWATVALGGGLASRRPHDVGAIGVGGIIGYALTGAFELGQPGGPANILELAVGATILGIVAGALAGIVAGAFAAIAGLAAQRGAGRAPAAAVGPSMASNGVPRRSWWASDLVGLGALLGLGLESSLTVLGLNSSNVHGHSQYWAEWVLFDIVVFVVAPLLAALGWGAAALSRWRGSATLSDDVELAVSATAVVAGIVAGAALHFGFAVSL